MKLEAISTSYTEDDQRNLTELLDIFGSVVSLEDIASAYCETGRDISAASEMLLSKKESSSLAGSSTSKSQDSLGSEASEVSWSSDNHLGQEYGAKVKQKRCSASMGTVVNMMGRDYAKLRPQSKGPCESHKPLKLNSDEIPESAIWNEENENESGSKSGNETMSNDMEEFLFEMLGNGFNMDMELIHDVVGQCGYDMQMSFDRLLDMSVETLGKSDDVIDRTSGNKTENGFGLEATVRCQSPLIDSAGRSNTDKPQTAKQNMEKEILESLFSVTKKVEEQHPSLPVRRVLHNAYGRAVAKPLMDTTIEDFTFIPRGPANNENNEENEKSYEDCRDAVKEYWLLMKEYYKAAVDAFSKREYEKAQKLRAEGNFFMKKLREADDESCRKMIGNSHEEEEEFCMNVFHLEPRDALRHLKLQLKTLAGLDTFSDVKVVVGTDDVNAQDAKRKRLVTKLLEKEEIPWTEEGNGWTICIRVDEIDPDKLSFVKK